MTDGVTDMLICDSIEQDKIREEDSRMINELSAEELKNKIQERWGQEWIMRPLNQKEQKARYEKDQFDDVGIARMVIRLS